MATVHSRRVRTGRLETELLEAGPPDAPTLVLVHGNISSSAFFADTMARLGDTLHCLAPDLRGFGGSDRLPVDARRGLADFADDLHELLTELGVYDGGRQITLLGWSLGGGVAMQYLLDHPSGIAGLVLEAAMSPYGFGGTKDLAGTPCTPDFAGSGGGTANAELVRLIAEGDRSGDSDASPRRVLATIYVAPDCQLPDELTDRLVDGMLAMATGPDFYPGDATPSPHWPGMAPGSKGVNNALSPKYCDLSRLGSLPAGPEILWIRGDSDQMVSDSSLADLGTLGQLGVVPGWPGAEDFPPQPMLGQLRSVLSRYGRYREEVLAGCGHSPHLEQPAAFEKLVREFIG